MSVLSDLDLSRELAYGDLEVEPIDISEQLQPNSLDIRLGNQFSKFELSEEPIDTKKGINKEYIRDFEVSDHYVLEPGEFVLANTKEWMEIPNYLYAELNGRSSFARLGLEIHSTGGVVDSMFKGELVLEVSNNSNRAVKIYPGQRIAQLIFYELNTPCNNGYSDKNNKYQGQEGAVHSRLEEDYE